MRAGLEFSMSNKPVPNGTSNAGDARDFPWNRGFWMTLIVAMSVFILFPAGSLLGEIGLSILTKAFASAAFIKANRDAVQAAIGNGGYLVGSILAISFFKVMTTGQSLFEMIRGRAQDIRGKWGYTIGLAFIGFFLTHVLDALYMMLPLPTPHVPASDFAQTLSGPALLIFGLGASFAGPFFEEIIFRGFIYNMFCKVFSDRWNPGSKFTRITGLVLANVLSAALFAGLHMTLSAFVPLFMFGVVAAELYRRSGNIYASMLMHFLNNGSITLIMLLAAHGS
jgi:membrane protease YdiL (CAAX protease family)